MSPESIIAALLSGAAGALGLGGGTVFLMYLAIKDVPQLKAQGINLLFFLPCALVSIIFNSKKKLVRWRVAIPMALGGFLGALCGSWFANWIGGAWMRKIFAVFLIIIGLTQLKNQKKQTRADNTKEQHSL